MDNQNNDNQPDEQSQPERAPNFVPSRTGRTISYEGLIERIVEEFYLEHGEQESDALKNSTTVAERRSLIRDVADYILGVESIQLELAEKARILARLYGEIFAYGPIDALLTDERVTTIALEGVDKVSVRYEPGTELVKLDSVFEDTHHLQQSIKRLLRDAGAELRNDTPIIEAGLTYEGRRVALNVAVPPYVTELAADMRVHPAEPLTLTDLAESGFMDTKAAELLQAIADSEHGMLIVGDTESGKTTVLNALIQNMPNICTVERAGELALPDDAEQLVATWAVEEKAGINFGERIHEALAKDPACVVLDEVRADDPQSIAPLLNDDNAPRQIWSFRGSSNMNRIVSSLGMLARLSDPSSPEAMVLSLQKRLPFVIVVKRRRGYLQLREIAEWRLPDEIPTNDFYYCDYKPLLSWNIDAWELTAIKPQHTLNLPADFWE